MGLCPIVPIESNWLSTFSRFLNPLAAEASGCHRIYPRLLALDVPSRVCNRFSSAPQAAHGPQGRGSGGKPGETGFSSFRRFSWAAPNFNHQVIGCARMRSLRDVPAAMAGFLLMLAVWLVKTLATTVSICSVEYCRMVSKRFAPEFSSNSPQLWIGLYSYDNQVTAVRTVTWSGRRTHYSNERCDFYKGHRKIPINKADFTGQS